MAASRALPTSALVGKAWAGSVNSLPAVAACGLEPASPTFGNQPPRSREWTPLNQALDGFFTRTHRFDSERMTDQLAEPIVRLESMLLVAGQGIEELLSADFRGASLLPARETSSREDSAFKIRRPQ